MEKGRFYEPGCADMGKISLRNTGELPQRFERLLAEAKVMEEKCCADRNIRKVYSDVHFSRLIDDIEVYREQLKTAKELFG